MTQGRGILGTALVALALALVPTRGIRSAEADASRTPRSAERVEMTLEEQRFLDLINQERRQRGLRPLTANPILVQVGRAHSREMAEKEYFAHESPTPGLRTPMDRYVRALPRRPAYACIGENLYYSSVVDVERGHQALMNSPSHRDNILYPRFQEAGVGIYKSPGGEFWVTEMFLSSEG